MTNFLCKYGKRTKKAHDVTIIIERYEVIIETHIVHILYNNSAGSRFGTAKQKQTTLYDRTTTQACSPLSFAFFYYYFIFLIQVSWFIFFYFIGFDWELRVWCFIQVLNCGSHWTWKISLVMFYVCCAWFY